MVYLPFLDVNIFGENKNLQLTSIEKETLWGFTQNSKVLYLKHMKLV